MSPLHMLLQILKACMQVEDNDGSVFVVPSLEKNQSPIFFGRVWHHITTSKESDKDLEPPKFFHYARSAHLMMNGLGYDLCRGESLNFGKGWRIPLQPFMPKGKPANYYDQTCRGLGYVTPSAQSDSESEKTLPSYSSDSSNWKFDVSMGLSSRSSSPIWHRPVKWNKKEDIELFDTDPWVQ